MRQDSPPASPITFDQAAFDLRCEWGQPGIDQLSPISDVVIVVDVLSFSNCVDIATGRGAIVYPYRWRDESAQTYAELMGAVLAGQRGSSQYSLSPTSLQFLDAGVRLVLPSPNGSTLSLTSSAPCTLAGCLRNSRAVAAAAQSYGQRIAVVPAGEKWPDGSLRPAFEDLVGAGAILSSLEGRLSPEAQAAVAVFQSAQAQLESLIQDCCSGRELRERDFDSDVALAAALNVSDRVPTLIKGAYIDPRPRYCLDQKSL